MSTDTIIRSLLIPLNQEHLLLPSAVIVEVTHDLKSEKIAEDHPDWILGNVLWRNQQVPLMSVEKIFPLPPLSNIPTRKNYTIILYGIEFPHVLPFYALNVQDVPRVLNISSTHLSITNSEPPHPAIVFSVKINQEMSAWLPNLTYLENLTRKSQLNKIEED